MVEAQLIRILYPVQRLKYQILRQSLRAGTGRGSARARQEAASCLFGTWHCPLSLLVCLQIRMRQILGRGL